MCVGDEVQRKKEDLCPAPRLLLWLEPKRDPGKVRVMGLLRKGSEGQRGGQRPREKGMTY